MDQKIKEILAKIKAFFVNMSQKTRRLLIIAGIVLLIAIIGIVIFVSNRPYTVLFTGMTAEDMSSVVSYLEGAGITDYQVQGNDTILVPEKQEASLKMKLLMEGYPTSGFGYSRYLDNINSLATESDRRMLYLYDLQDRLGAVVRCFDGVKDAKVTIAQGEDNSYVLQRDNVLEASASVIVIMEGSQRLSTQQADAIRHLISSAVQGLVIENISISDPAGTPYSGSDEESSSEAAQLKFELEARVNENVRNNVLQVLTPLFGAENVYVGVKSTVDISRTYLDSTTYQEPDWAADGSTNGEGIIGSRIYSNAIEQGEGNAGGVVGTQSNADFNTYVEEYQPDGSEQRISSSGEINYNVDTFHRQSETPAGVIEDVMVSISINSTAAGNVNTDALVPHVARAAGIGVDVQGEKISIVAMPFYTGAGEAGDESDNNISGLPMWVIFVIIGAVVVFILLFVLLLLLSKRRKRRLQETQTAAAMAGTPIAADGMQEILQQQPITESADIMDVHTERAMELRKDVRKFAEESPEIAAQMVKSWLKGGEEENG